nr:MAG TPA: hypothetical protein [Caudoviricetes sp.]
MCLYDTRYNVERQAIRMHKVATCGLCKVHTLQRARRQL